MPIFTCLITDERYAVPSLIFNVAPDLARVRALARADLAANPCHSAFEVRDGDELLFVETRAVLGPGL